ncbi:hypothetical protein FRB99_008843 [Tulasnella sp. 403]|nr:hypothetical protein FRB99_008843 [Tulasnella sp. 403]
MQLYRSLTFLAVFLGNVLALGHGIPDFYYVGSGNFTLAGAFLTIKGPLGNRLSDHFSAGTIIDHRGRRIAEFVNGTGVDNGSIDLNGQLHVDLRSTWILADGEPAYMTFQGIGPLGQVGWYHFAVESGSTEFGYLSKIFIFGNNTVASGSVLLDFWSPSDPDA